MIAIVQNFISFSSKVVFLFIFKCFLKDLFIYFWLLWTFGAACRPSLVVESRGYSPAPVCGLLLVVVSLAVEHGLQSTGSVVVGLRFSCPEACGIFPNQGWKLCPLHWQVDSLSLSHQRSPQNFIILFIKWVVLLLT